MTDLVGIELGGAAAATLHQDRLVLVGTRGVPDLVLASKTGEWTDFDLTREVTSDGDTTEVATAADGFWFQQSSSRNNGFHSLLQQEGLLIFGDIGESIIAPGPFTAAQVQARENSWFGSDRGRQPLISEGLAVFLQRGGSDIRGIRWTEVQRKYEAPSLKEYAGPVFTNAVDMAAQGSDEGQAPAIVLVDEDGGVALCSIRQQLQSFRQFPSWATWTTQGEFRGVAGLTGTGNALIFAVERGGRIRLEQLADFQVGEPNVDARDRIDLTGVTASPTSRTLPEYLVGRVRFYWNDGEDWQATDAIEVPADGLDYTVTSELDGDGVRETTIRFGDSPIVVRGTDTIYVGLAFDGEVETMPFVARTESGPRINALFSRIFNLVVAWSGQECRDMLILASRGRPRRARGRQPRVTPPGVEPTGRGRVTEGQSRTLEYGGLVGWQQRSTVYLVLPSACEIASISYRASG